MLDRPWPAGTFLGDVARGSEVDLRRALHFQWTAENAQVHTFRSVRSDVDEHRGRVEDRVTDIPGLAQTTWPEVVCREYEHWDQDRVVIDTAGATVEQSLAVLIARLED